MRRVMPRLISLLITVCIVLALVSGCAGEQPAASPTSPPAASGATGEKQDVVDSLGTTVTIPKPAQRIASLRSGITEIICALGQKDKIVAVDEMVKAGNMYGAFIAGVYPDLKDRDCPVGGAVNIEELLRIDPDVVLHGGYGRIKQADTIKEQTPIPVVIAHFETLENYMADIRIVAKVVGAESRAEELIQYLQSKLDFVASRVKDVPEDQKVRVYYAGHDVYHVYTSDTFEHAQIVAAGGQNVAKDLTGWLPEVSPEQLIAWDPQVIVMLNGVDVNTVLNDSKLTGVSAVKNKQVYSLPEASWDFSSPRALFCIEWLASKLYPDRFKDVDIAAEADEFYTKVFGVKYGGPPLASASSPSTQTITDMNGRTVEIPVKPDRVVSVFPYLTVAALALGKADTLVGVDSASLNNPNLARIFPEVKGIADVGSAFAVNKESILLVEPQVVLTVAWDRDPDKTQSTIGVPVVCVDMNYYKESLEFIAKVLGAEDKAKDFISYYDQKKDYISSRLSDVAAEEKTKVYIGGGKGRLSTFGKESTWHYEIEDAGGVNVAADIAGGGSQDVSMEQVLAWNPDVIVLDKSCTDKIDDVLSDPRWQPVNAVKNKRVYRAPDGFLDTWGRPHLESALARVWMADKLYPEKLGLDVVEEAKSFYAKFYGLSLSDDEISKILNPE